MMQMILTLAVAASAVIFACSSQATIVIGAVLLVQLCLGRALTSQARYLLWTLVLVRLIVPVFPAADFSVLNLLPGDPVPNRAPASMASTRHPPVLESQNRIDEDVANSSNTLAGATHGSVLGDNYVPLRSHNNSYVDDLEQSALPGQATAATQQRHTGSAVFETTVRIFTAIWIAGLIFFGARLGLSIAQVNKLAIAATDLTDATALQIFEECRNTVGVSRRVKLLETTEHISPSVVGVFHPTIILPAGILDSLSSTELRHILLHELTHVRRHDVAVQWIGEVIRIVHWFNPTVWFALRHLKQQRELACDADVLGCSKEDDATAYGQTTIKLLSLLRVRQRFPAAVGMLDHQSATMRRIKMIGNFRTPSRLRSWSSFLLVATIAAICLTSATPTDAAAGDPDQNAAASQESQSVSATQPREKDSETGWEFELQGFHFYDPGQQHQADTRYNFEVIYTPAEEPNAAFASAMPPEDEPVKEATDSITLILSANRDGSLQSMQLGNQVIASQAGSFKQLAAKMSTWAGEEDRAELSLRELEIRPDITLNYDIVAQAISACTGRTNPETGKTERFVHRIRFATPKELKTLEVKLGYLRSVAGEQMSNKLVVMIDDQVAQLSTAAKGLQQWLKEHDAKAASVILKIRSDEHIPADSVQQLIAIAQPIGFQRVALHTFATAKPVNVDRTVTVFQLKFVAALETAELLKDLFGEEGPKVVADQRTNSVVVEADAADMKVVRQILERIDNDEPPAVENEGVYVFPLKQIDPIQAARTLKAFFPDDDDSPKIEADGLSGRLIVKCDKETRELISRLLKELDTAARSAMPADKKNPAADPRTDQTSFMGVPDHGSRILFVVDRSASMAGGRMDQVIQELTRSLHCLSPTQHFQIIFYNEHTNDVKLRTKNREEFYVATPENISLASRELLNVYPHGGTSHMPALAAALKLKPDVVYFLSDGQAPRLTTQDVSLLRQLKPHSTSLNVLETTTEGKIVHSESWLRELAAELKGSWQTVALKHGVATPVAY